LRWRRIPFSRLWELSAVDITQTLFVGAHALLVEGPGDLVVSWFSRELRARRRTGLDRRWTITPVGGLSKISSFAALFGPLAMGSVLAIERRLAKLEAKTGAGDDLRNLTGEELFQHVRRLVDENGGIEIVAATLRAEGENALAASVEANYACQTVEQFMGYEDGPNRERLKAQWRL
jgi:hypothetical protein